MSQSPIPGSQNESVISAPNDHPLEALTAPVFNLVRRGFDRQQVTEQFAEFVDRITALNTKVAGLTAQATNERQRAEHAEQELRQALSRVSSIERANNHGFGERMERLMLVAEQQAVDVIERAEQQAREIVEAARDECEEQRRDAEAHRRDVEQTLVARASTLDQEAARRSAVLQRRESDIAASQVAARQQVEEIRAAADRDTATSRERALIEAADVRADAQNYAAALRDKAQAEANAELDRGARELARLIDTKDGARADLARFSKMLVEMGETLANELPSNSCDDTQVLNIVSKPDTAGVAADTSRPRGPMAPTLANNGLTNNGRTNNGRTAAPEA
ncbi:MAG: hypothetical protein ACR2GH_23295 [Pseudonocardia sp.]